MQGIQELALIYIYQWKKTKKGIQNILLSPTKNGLMLKSKILLAQSHKNIIIISELFKPIFKFAVENILPKYFHTTCIFNYATAGAHLLDSKKTIFCNKRNL